MATVSATKAKQNFAALLDQAQREPVRIQRHERDVAVILSAEEYERLQQFRVQTLLHMTEETGRYAASRGMNDEVLEDLLTDER